MSRARLSFLALPLLSLLSPPAPCSSSSSASPTDAGGVDASIADAGHDATVGDAAPEASEDDAGVCTSPEFQGSPLGVHCNALVDTSGRTVLLHGVNARAQGVFDVTFTDGRLPVETIPLFTAADAARIRALGFNALRLPLSWSAIEPQEDAGVDSTYFDKVAAITAFCAAAGVYVLLDLHQDAYSKEIGEDGAPLWAIQPPPTQLLGGPLTDLGARIDSTQVQDAYNTLFESEEAGVPLRVRYAQMAAAVAARFANDPAVIGVELYNEPFATSAALLAFHQEMIAAVRPAAPGKLILFEPAGVRNELDTAPYGPGSIGAGTAYAPHVYTLAFTEPNAVVTKTTFANSNDNARDEADSWQAPLVITEYGYPPDSTNFTNWAKWQAELEDEVKASSFFWVWKEDSQGSWGFYDFDDDAGTQTERPAVVQAMTRTRLEAVAGELVSATYDEDAMVMTVVFDGSSAVTAANIVSVGVAATVPAASWKATCDGQSVATSGSDPLSISCSGPGTHTLTVSAH